MTPLPDDLTLLRDEYRDWREHLPLGLDGTTVPDRLDAILDTLDDLLHGVIGDERSLRTPLG